LFPNGYLMRFLKHNCSTVEVQENEKIKHPVMYASTTFAHAVATPFPSTLVKQEWFRVHLASVKGRAEVNEDAVVSVQNENCRLIAVADGLGGHCNGQMASHLATSILTEAFFTQLDTAAPAAFLQAAAMQAHEAIVAQTPVGQVSGTTLSGVLVVENQYYVFHIGDSRVYRYSYVRQQMMRLTTDHSTLQEQADRQSLEEYQLADCANRNLITAALGMPDITPELEVSGPLPLLEGTWLLATTDGVHDYLSDEIIRQVVSLSNMDYNPARLLVSEAYEAGSLDNLSAIALIYA
jgi:protein phosphatase